MSTATQVDQAPVAGTPAKCEDFLINEASPAVSLNARMAEMAGP
jgi:hypothetical protein